MLLLCLPWRVRMPDANSSLLVPCSSRIKDGCFPNLIVVSQWQRASYPPFCTCNCTYIPCSPYTHLEYHDTAHNTLLTRMCDKITDSDNCLAFLSVHHWTFSLITFTLCLVWVDLLVHTYSVQSAMNLWISSRAWSAYLRSLRASRDFRLISTSFMPNTWLTAFTSLRLLPPHLCCTGF